MLKHLAVLALLVTACDPFPFQSDYTAGKGGTIFLDGGGFVPWADQIPEADLKRFDARLGLFAQALLPDGPIVVMTTTAKTAEDAEKIKALYTRSLAQVAPGRAVVFVRTSAENSTWGQQSDMAILPSANDPTLAATMKTAAGFIGAGGKVDNYRPLGSGSVGQALHSRVRNDGAPYSGYSAGVSVSGERFAFMEYKPEAAQKNPRGLGLMTGLAAFPHLGDPRAVGNTSDFDQWCTPWLVVGPEANQVKTAIGVPGQSLVKITGNILTVLDGTAYVFRAGSRPANFTIVAHDACNMTAAANPAAVGIEVFTTQGTTTF